jgi:hypothetical protein
MGRPREGGAGALSLDPAHHAHETVASARPGSKIRFVTNIARFMAFAALALAGCSTPLDIQVVGRPGIVLAPTPPDQCRVRLYGEKDRLPRGCTTEIGDVFLGESGTTGTEECTWDSLSKEAVRQVCLAGADLGQIVMSQAPQRGLTTCYQMRVRFVRCAAEASPVP